jgi:hypothetical protein
MTLGEHDEGMEERPAVFRGGGEVAAYRAELLVAGEGPQAARHLLPEFDHPDVVGGHAGVVGPSAGRRRGGRPGAGPALGASS